MISPRPSLVRLAQLRTIGKHAQKATKLTFMALMMSCIAGCVLRTDPDSLNAADARSTMTKELTRQCIEAGGGPQMDAVDIYGSKVEPSVHHLGVSQDEVSVAEVGQRFATENQARTYSMSLTG